MQLRTKIVTKADLVLGIMTRSEQVGTTLSHSVWSELTESGRQHAILGPRAYGVGSLVSSTKTEKRIASRDDTANEGAIDHLERLGWSAKFWGVHQEGNVSRKRHEGLVFFRIHVVVELQCTCRKLFEILK